jgi:hypothetical protein
MLIKVACTMRLLSVNYTCMRLMFSCCWVQRPHRTALAQSVVPWLLHNALWCSAGCHVHVADLLLSSYVELHGSELSLLVQQSMAAADWLTLPAPAGPQPVCNMLLQRLGRAEAEVGRLLESTGRQQGGRHVRLGQRHCLHTMSI